VQCGNYVVNNTVAYLKVAKRLNLESSHHKKKNCVTMFGDYFTVYTDNSAEHLKLIMLYVSYTSVRK